MNINSNTLSILPKSNKNSKASKANRSKRKRKHNSEKHMEKKDEELPWPPPSESATAIYNELVSSNFKIPTLVQPNVLPKSNIVLNNQKNFDKYLGGAPRSGFNLLGSSKCIPMPNSINCSRPSVPINPTNSEDVCTLFHNPFQVGSSAVPQQRQLPPIGVFWDIENCSVPKARSALVAVQRIRDRFFPGHVEAEFLCVCDIRKESPGIIQELNDAQVSVIHVSGNSKNAADDKLRQSMRRFADIYSTSGHLACPTSPFPATIILISGDINFSSDLSDLRHRKRLYVILLHNKHAADALLLCAHENYDFHTFLGNLPPRPLYLCRDNNAMHQQHIPLKGGLQAMDVMVCDLPHASSKTHFAIRNRLKKLSENCGGKVITLQGQFAILRFPNKEAAMRATKRMNGENVLGSKIRVIYSSQMEFRTPESEAVESVENVGVPLHQNTSIRQMSQTSSVRGQSPSWKPTWKSRTSVGSFLSPSKLLLASQSGASPVIKPNNLLPPQTSSFHQQQQRNSATNSSSPYDSSREGSPIENSTNQVVPEHTSTPLLNNGDEVPQQNNEMSAVDPKSNQENNYYDGTGKIPRLYSNPFAPRSSSTSSNIPSNLNGSPSSQKFQQRILPTASFRTPEESSSRSSSDSNLAGASAALLLGTFNSQYHLENSPSSSTTMRGRPQDADHFDLHITNIDPNLGDWKIVRHALTAAFAEHVNVKGVWVYISQDGAVSSVVRVGNKEEAHYAVAQLHRKKFGSKRIFISFDEGGSVDQETLKKEVATLLQDVPGASLPLFKFREMFEKRYRRSVSSSDLYRLKEVVSIAEQSMNGVGSYSIGRTISLTNEWKNKDDKNLSLYCLQHPPKKNGSNKARGWAEKESEVLLPNVVVELKTLATRVNSLLSSHRGVLPLISFMDCYEAEFEKMEIVDGSGVPLEHLLACVKGVEITSSDNGMKRLQWIDATQIDTGIMGQPLATQLLQFGREMVDLLKTFPRCALAFSKLIPAYHHHFGRQCRVADYGHFNLQSLLQTVPHVIQMLGSGQNRILCLSHKAQMKRFATDLLRVLKAHGGAKKQIKVDDFSQGFSQVFMNRQFTPEDYGLCYFSDLISELVENSTLVALVKDDEGNQMLAVPKREQTPQEIHRTRIFASEVVELFRHSIRYEMPFSKFIPAYHHHFGKQCRVSDYGFSKLAELFDAIADTVVCVSPQGPSSECSTDDKIVRLVSQEQVKVVGEQLQKLIQSQTDLGNVVRFEEIDELFIQVHGFQLDPEMCEADDIENLITNKLSSYLKVDNGIITAVDPNEVNLMMNDIIAVLEGNPEYRMDLDQFLASYEERFDKSLAIETIQGQLCQFLVLSEPDQDGKITLSLEPLRIFARELVQILEEVGGYLMVNNIEAVYLQRFNRPLRPAQMGYPSVIALIQAIPDVAQIRGRHRTKQVCLVGAESSDGSSFEDNSRSYRSSNSSRHNESFREYKNTTRAKSAEQFRPFNHHLKLDSGRWSESPKRRAQPPPPLYIPSPSTGFHQRQVDTTAAFNFDRQGGPISPPTYDMWMRSNVDPISPGSPPLSPPMVWTYHPIVYPPNTPPGNGPNIMMPTFTYPPPWSPPNCYERLPNQNNGAMMGHEYGFADHQRITHGMEQLGLGMDRRNDN